MVSCSVTPWLLRRVLLLEAGIEPNLLRFRHWGNSRFLAFRANVAQSVSELGWQVPPPGLPDGEG
jgi:hypothetical protein